MLPDVENVCANSDAPWDRRDHRGERIMIEADAEQLADRRLALLRDIADGYATSTQWSQLSERTARAIAAIPCGIAFVLIYIIDPLRTRLSLIGSAGIPLGHAAAPQTIALDRDDAWSIRATLSARRAQEAPGVALRELPLGIDGRSAGSAVTIPITPVHDEPWGVMVFGLDADASADPGTRTFLDLLAAQVSGGVARVAMTSNRSMLATLGLTAPAAIFLKDLEGRYAFANAMTCEMLGRLDVIGRTDAELLEPPLAERMAAQDRAVVARNASAQFEEQIGDRDYLLIKFPWPNPDGGFIGVYGVAIDISARKHIEETLRNSERQYRAIGESIDYGVWVCDGRGRNVYASDSFLKLTGLTQDECADLGWSSVLHPDDVDATLAAWQACVDSGALWDREHRIKGVDGEYHHVLARGVPVRDANGAIVSWAGINLDISNIKEAEAALREADRRKDDFLSLLAHELRNPLAPIRSSLEAMSLRGLRDDVQRHAHDVISRQVASLVRMVDDLLDVARITHGKLSLQIEVVEIGRVVEEAIETARPYVDEMGHSLDVFMPTEPVHVNVDPVRLTQVVANLLSNSAKYTPSGGHIELRASVSSDGVEIAVTDNGAGIAPDLQHSVFELFSQHHGRGGVGSASGLGIGLALVRDLMDMHGGTVRAHSAGVGRGSTFTITLPASSIAARPKDARPLRAIQSDTTRRRVLVVDDNVDAAESMAALLHLLGHEAQIANDGRAAIERAQRFQPDLILMDLGMPGMDGMQATMRIRALPLQHQPTIAAVTGWNQEASRAEARNAGIDLHVVKPIDVPGLQRILRAVRTRVDVTR